LKGKIDIIFIFGGSILSDEGLNNELGRFFHKAIPVAIEAPALTNPQAGC
jgi:hypothetical protein